MIIKTLYLTNFKRHKSAEFHFEPGSNMIVGNNYAGKSTLIQAIFIALFGNSTVTANVKELPTVGATDFKIELTLSNGYQIMRTSRDSSVTKPDETVPFVRGHTAVNAAVAELVGLDKDTFMKVFASEQGQPQQLLAMEGAQLQRFVESITGMDKLDELIRLANRYIKDYGSRQEALSYMVLEDEKYQELKTQFDANTELLENNASLKNHYDLQLHNLTNQIDGLCKFIDMAGKNNREIERYTTERGKLEVLLSDLPDRLEIQDETAQVSVVANCKTYYHLMDTLRTAVEGRVNLERLLDSKPQLDYHNTEDLQAEVMGLWDRYNLASVQFKELSDANRTAEQCQKLIDSTEQSLKDLGYLKPEPEDLNLVLEGLKRQNYLLLDQIKSKEEALKSGFCSQCSRPYDDHLDKDSLLEEIDFIKLTHQKALGEEGLLVERIAERRLHKEKQGQLEYTLINTKLQLASAQTTQETLKSVENPGDLKSEWNNASKDLERKTSWNATAEHSNRERSQILGRLRELPEDDLVTVKTLFSEAGDKLNEETSTLGRIRLENKATDELIFKKKCLLSQLDKLVEPKEPHVDLEQQSEMLSGLRTEHRQCSDKIEQTRQEIMELTKTIAPAQGLIKNHEQAYEKVCGYKVLVGKYQFISTLLTNSRAGFIEKYLSTIFSVTSEFARQCTSGDISEVYLQDGIKYCEKGNHFTKNAASGAQRSIIGLGMKLGIANLVISDFGCLLLDEVSADMSEDISLKCALALDSLCEQSITVSHRKMDVAGNVITL